MARRRRPTPQAPGQIPTELLDQLHPVWRDELALRQHPDFGPYVDARTIERLRAGASAFHMIAARYLCEHGFESEKWPNVADWHRFRAAAGDN